MSNIFFDSLPAGLGDSVRTGEAWRAVQLADIVSVPGMKSIRVLRFKRGIADDVQYVVDTTGDLDFRHGQPLMFERRGALRVANLELMVRSDAGSQRRVPYQVLVADDGYTYARIADYRSGTITVGGRSYAITLRNRGRSHPFYGASEFTTFMVDLDGDGRFAEQASLSVRGQPMATEQVMARTPFLLNGRAFEVTAVDSAGSEVRLMPATQSSAVAVNFRAPDIRAELLAGGEFRLSQQLGTVVLIEFWATDCLFSEKVRAAANALAGKHGSALSWVAVSREHDRAVIDKHLVKAPMRATVTLADSAAWATYNPGGATPLFVVVDQKGVIQFTAAGASAMEAVTATVDRLIAAARSRE